MQRKIKAILSPFGIMNYVDAKKFLARHDIDDIIKKLKTSGHIDKILELGHFKS